MIETVTHNILENGILPLVVYQNTIHLYYEGVWHSFDTAEEERLALIKPLVQKSIGERPKAKYIDAVHMELKTEFYPLENYVDRKEIYINTKDHLLVISEDGAIAQIPHDPSLGFLWKLQQNYVEDAECPLFNKFLHQVIGEDEAIKVLQEYLGYVFLPHSHLNIEKALWLVGSGSNGKSVLTSLLKYVFGEDNISYLNLPELNDNEKRGMLKGKILNITQDASNRVDPSSYKIMASGEKVIFKVLYKGSSILKSVPKMIIATNELPRVVSGIDAFMRRVILIPFDKVIEEKDRDLELGNKLQAEMEGIFNFALQGLQRLLQQKHFTHSPMIEKAILEYKGELDILGDFLQDNPLESLQEKASGHITQNELYKRLADWCKDNDRKNSYQTPRKLRDKLVSDHGFSAYKNNTIYGIKGVWKSKNTMQEPANNPIMQDPYGSDVK